MKSFSKVLAKFSKVWMLALLCVLFLGVKAEAATGTVREVKQTNHTYNAVLLEWKIAAGDVNGYKVEWCKDTSFQGTTYGSSTEPITKVEYAIQGLAAGSDYYVRVSAIDSNGELGTPSAPLQVVTAPIGKVAGLTQTKAEAKNISLGWKKFNKANCYLVAYKKVGSTAQAQVKTVTKTSYKIASKAADSTFAVMVYPARKSKAGYVANAYGEDVAGAYMSTLPKMVTGVKMLYGGYGGNSQAGYVTFTWKPSGAADGYEYEIYGNNGKKIVKKAVKGYNQKMLIKNSKLKNDQFMKIRVRGYVQVGKAKKYGPWSDATWFAKFVAKQKGALVSNKASDGIRFSWAKTAGAKDYSVYLSRTANGKYTKVATTKGTSCVVKKLGGAPISTGYYYYYVVANKKVGKKVIQSDDTWYGSFRITTSYYY